jgi:hypothetical protein
MRVNDDVTVLSILVIYFILTEVCIANFLAYFRLDHNF